MYIQLSPEAAQTLKSLDLIPDSEAATPRSIAEELLSVGLAYESRALWRNQHDGRRPGVVEPARRIVRSGWPKQLRRVWRTRSRPP